jgi:hypothetical protein
VALLEAQAARSVSGLGLLGMFFGGRVITVPFSESAARSALALGEAYGLVQPTPLFIEF